MRSRIAWPFLATVTVALAVLWASGVRADTPESTATTEPDAGDLLRWVPLGGPYERVAFGLAYDRAWQTLYAGTWGHGLYSSWDGGETWEPVAPGTMPFVRTLAIPPSSPGAILAGTYSQGLHYSEDGGWRWKTLGEYGCLAAPRQAAHPLRTPRNIESLLVYSEGDTEWILVGTHNGICAGTVLSDTWTHLSDGFPDTDDAYYVYSLARDPAGRLYAGTRDGLYYYSPARDQQWHRIGPPPDLDTEDARRVLSLTVVTSTADLEGTLLIGTRGAGIYALEDPDAGVWEERINGVPDDPDARRIQALLATREGRVYAGTVDNGVLLSTDGGQNWTQMLEGLPDNARSVTALAWDRDSGTVYAGTYGDSVYRLIEGEEAWQPANRNLPVDFEVQKIAFAGTEGEALLAGLRVGGLYLYERGEETPAWQRLPDALPIGPARDVHGMAVTGSDRETVVAATSTGIRRRPGAGGEWQKLGRAEGLPEAEARATALVQGRKEPDILFAAVNTEDGLYRSPNGGANWTPAAGNLDEELRTSICCLAMGANDETVYLGIAPGEGTVYLAAQASSIYTRQVYLTDDGGASWQPLSPIEGQTLEELAWSRRTLWDVFLFGGPLEMLYARTKEGIYVSYDGGETWQLRLRGFFRDLLADPYRPWIVYAAAPDALLTKEFKSPVTLIPDLWISYYGGQTWDAVRPGPTLAQDGEPASITTLSFDPAHRDQLFAGTEGSGVFSRDRPRYPRPLTPRAVSIIILVALLLFLFVYTFGRGLILGRRYKLPPSTWLRLGILQIRRSRQVDLVAGPDTPLTALERLILVVAPDGRFSVEDVWHALNGQEIPVDLAQVQPVVVQRLATHYELLRAAGEGFKLVSPLLGLLAHARFWDDTVERDRLVREILAQSRLRADIRRFFRLVGFETFSVESGFRIASSLPEYALLGADRGIYVHPYRAGEESVPIGEAREGAYHAYETELSSRIAFLVVTCCPRLEDLRDMVHLRQQEGLRPVLLPYGQIRDVAEPRDSRQVLDRSLQRSLGDVDLFDLSTPAENPLDFWGRMDRVRTLMSLCKAGGVAGLAGMAGVGKTSLAWQVVHRLPNALIAWFDAGGPPLWTLYAALYEQWLEQAQMRFPAWEQPEQPPPSGRCTPTEIRDHLAVLRASLAEQDRAVHLAAVVDGLPGVAATWEPLAIPAQGIAETEGASLLCVFQHPVEVQGIDPIHLKPLEQEEGEEMIHVLAAQMGFEFEPEAAKRLHELSGGHPLILRQLASRTVLENRAAGLQIQAASVEQAAAWYLSQSHSALRDLWESLLEDEQRVVQAILAGEIPQPGRPLSLLQELGWLRAANGGWAVFSPALARWLEALLPTL
jgi:hypothetical protein